MIWPLCQGFCITATKTHSPGLLSTGVSPTCQSHSWDVTRLQGPALQTWTTELEGVCLWGTGCSNTHNLLREPLDISFVWHKRPAKGTVLWHTAVLETQRTAAVTAVQSSVLHKIMRVGVIYDLRAPDPTNSGSPSWVMDFILVTFVCNLLTIHVTSSTWISPGEFQDLISEHCEYTTL